MSPRLGAPPLERAEVYFADAARAMVEGGDWLVPHYQGKPFFDKPILTYWAMAASMEVFGKSPAAARVVPLVAALLAVLATVWLGLLLFERRSALAGGIVLATTVAFLSFSRVAMSDMLLAFFSTLAVALGVRSVRGGAPWATVALGAVLGLGFATKGPIALVVPGLALVLLAWQQRRRRPLPFGWGPSLAALLAFALLGLGWFLLLYRRLGAEPLVFFFFRENLERFAGESFDVGRPFWFYPPAYLAGGLPWSPLLPIALWRTLFSKDAAARRAGRLLAGWAALVLVPLSLSHGKIDYYLLPIYPAVSLLLGHHLGGLPWGRLDRWWARAVLLLSAASLVALVLCAPRLPEHWLPGPPVRTALVVVVVVSAVAALAASLRPRPPLVVGALALPVVGIFLLLVGWFLPAFMDGQPNRAIVEDVARERLYRPEARLAFCADPSRSRRDVLFAARHAALEQCDLWGLAGSRDPFLLLVSPSENASFSTLGRYRHVATYSYLPASTLTFDGFFSGPRPGTLLLVANFRTEDPLAEVKRKREYRKAVQAERDHFQALLRQRKQRGN